MSTEDGDVEPVVAVVDTVYSTVLVLDLEVHPENADAFAALLEEAQEEPAWVDSDEKGALRACWEFETPGFAQALYERLVRVPVCGMTAELIASTAWGHRRPH